MRKFFCVLLLLVFASCTITRPTLNVRVEQGPAYDSVYPYSIEFCGASRVVPFGKEAGGRHGHAVLYLKGVCRDESAPYPQIKVCEEGSVDLKDPEAGVGISVDKMFETANWVAVPGRKFFFYGDLERDQALDQPHLDSAVRKAEKLGLFKGIRFHAEYLKKKPSGMSESEFIARETVSTDYALTFGRSFFCVKLPVTRPMLERTVSFLNDLNRKYATGKTPYEWSGYFDNCAHTAHNALAAAGVWKTKQVKKVPLDFFSNLAVPANEFADLAFLTGAYPLENEGKIKRDKVMKKSLLEDGWLPARHGALLSVIPVHETNELYEKQFTTYLLDQPFTGNKWERVRGMVTDKRFTDIESNLRYFGERYNNALTGACAGEGARDPFRKAYCGYMRTQLEDVEVKLKQCASERSFT